MPVFVSMGRYGEGSITVPFGVETMQDEHASDRDGLAAAWSACVADPPSAPAAGGQLARALLLAARWGLCRTAWRQDDEVPVT